MRRALTAMLLALMLWNVAAGAQQRPGHKHPAKVVQPAPDPPPAPPQPPPTLEQMPAVAPEVRFSRGLLTIVAENSTLSDILRAVHAQTGAVIEVPPNATERVATHLGPGPARDVLATLLNGSHFNYVMVGSPAHPDSVDRLILTSKAGGEPATAPPAPAAQNNNEAQVDDPGPSGTDIAEQPVDDPAENAANESQQPPNGQPQVKTPEQLLRELQQQQLQQQQQQPATATPQDGQPRSN
jgi:hypothetical protein